MLENLSLGCGCEIAIPSLRVLHVCIEHGELEGKIIAEQQEQQVATQEAPGIRVNVGLTPRLFEADKRWNKAITEMIKANFAEQDIKDLIRLSIDTWWAENKGNILQINRSNRKEEINA